MYFISAWVGKHKNDISFERMIPLAYLGRWLEHHKSKEVIHVLLLEGYDRLSSSYIRKLKTFGIHLIDLSAEYRQLAQVFKPLERFGQYETHCFLRWPVLARYLQRENIALDEQVIHIDGDVIFNAKPEEIAKDVQNLTFVLQGCPAFVSISDREWFESYTKELSRFVCDIEGYSARAWQERLGWEASEVEKWAGQRYREIITSDQDFISHLIHTDRIIQDNPKSFAPSLSLYYSENPLFFEAFADLQLGKSSELRFWSDSSACYVESKRIAFWHFQNGFAAYVNAAIILSKFRYPFRHPGPYSRLIGFWSRIPLPFLRMCRRDIYESLIELNIEKKPTSLGFGAIFNRRSYWRKGIFSNS